MDTFTSPTSAALLRRRLPIGRLSPRNVGPNKGARRVTFPLARVTMIDPFTIGREIPSGSRDSGSRRPAIRTHRRPFVSSRESKTKTHEKKSRTRARVPDHRRAAHRTSRSEQLISNHDASRGCARQLPRPRDRLRSQASMNSSSTSSARASRGPRRAPRARARDRARRAHLVRRARPVTRARSTPTARV